MLQTQNGLTYQPRNSAYSGFNNTLEFSGSDVVLSVGAYTLDAASFFQLTPQQMMTPVYSVFESQPSGFLQGNELIKGIIGLNMQFLNYFESLATLPATKPFVRVLQNGVVNINELIVTFRGREYKPVITLNDVQIFGGSLSANVEGTPIQVVHEFIARSMLKTDMEDDTYYTEFSKAKANSQVMVQQTPKDNIPGMKPLQGRSTSFNDTNSITVNPDNSVNVNSSNGYFKLANVNSSDQSALRQYMGRYANTNLGYYTNGTINKDGTQNAVLFDNKGNNINSKLIHNGVATYSPNVTVGTGYNNYMKMISTQ